MKKPTKTIMTKKLDKLWSEIIRSVAHCEKCGKMENLQAAHIITRSNRRLRWDLRNGICLCAYHHLFWAHKEPLEFADFIRHYRSNDYEYLMDTKKDTIHRTIPDYEDLYEELTQELDAATELTG